MARLDGLEKQHLSSLTCASVRVGFHGTCHTVAPCSTGAPAYAICLSGGYEDDDDHGALAQGAVVGCGAA